MREKWQSEDHKRVLVVEDDPDIQELLQYNLEREGYLVQTAASGRRGLDLANQGKSDLILLDLMLPDTPGLEVCRRLRLNQQTSAVPIIILTARDEERDVVLGLELGADDYVTKPFSVRELMSRIRAVLRRAGRPTSQESVIRVAGVEIDQSRHEVRVTGQLVELTLAEFRLLSALASRPGQVMTRDQLLDHITGGRAVIVDRNVDVHVRAIRKKLGDSAGLIATVRGVGYKCRAV